MEQVFKDLEYAKKAVLWLLDHEAGLVDWHDMVYWSGEVLRLRKKIKEAL